MIFSPEQHCIPVSTFEHTSKDIVALGEKNMLNILLISSGQCSTFHAKTPIILNAGDFLLFSQSFNFSPMQKTHFLGISLQGVVVETALQNLSSPMLFNSQTCPDAPELLYRLQSFSQLPFAKASALAYALLCEVTQASPMPKNIPVLVISAISEIHNHYAEVYGIEELASELGVSKSHLVRTFTASIGTSPGRYLTNIRLDAAKRLLLHREYTIDAIANLCGFAGANYFCRVFKKETGQTPASWRTNALHSRIPLPEMDEREAQFFL